MSQISLSSHFSRKKRNKLEGERVRNEIRRLYAEGNDSRTICKTLDLSYDVYRYYCSKIYKEDRDELKRIRSQQLATEYITARNRLLMGIRNLEALIAKDIPPKEKIEAIRLSKEISFNILQLMIEGPKLVENNTESETKPVDDFPVDEFVAFAEKTANEKFQRPNNDIANGDSIV